MSFKNLIAFLSAVLLGQGFGHAGLLNPQTVMGFFDLQTPTFNLPLCFLFFLLTFLPAFLLVKSWKHPILEKSWHVERTSNPELLRLLGFLLFGVGMALSGLSPAFALAELSIRPSETIAFLLMLLIGIKITGIIRKQLH
ncbi:MAG TPA: hypothetical protein DCL41_09865 [Bdellovibrionales bacterium]|nr:hypothetical protein [Pseudobdellovibrionaceae bacterium]HAG92169.1 hypothetical protein [Bdellovibrionales bacterium]|tara:strand:- start:1442 stop:1861 length:420 start_codon:yes stop_codon:yes gene_type:complete